MAENEVQVEANEQVEEQEAHAEQDSTNWKDEARKWEKRAKENKSAADELARLKEAQMSEQEKLTARAEKAEAELSALAAKAQREEAAKTISKDSNVPQELLMYCADEEAMQTFADKYNELTQAKQMAPKALSSRISRGTPAAKQSNRERFAELAEQQLQKGM